jgi:hypothetical protein
MGQTQGQQDDRERATLERENQVLSRNLAIMNLENNDTGNKLILPGDEPVPH